MRRLPIFFYQGPQHQGGKRIYTATMFEYLLTVKVFLRLPWRATAGFIEGLFKKAFPEQRLPVPDYAHACRESSKIIIAN